MGINVEISRCLQPCHSQNLLPNGPNPDTDLHKNSYTSQLATPNISLKLSTSLSAVLMQLHFLPTASCPHPGSNSSLWSSSNAILMRLWMPKVLVTEQTLALLPLAAKEASRGRGRRFVQGPEKDRSVSHTGDGGGCEVVTRLTAEVSRLGNEAATMRTWHLRKPFSVSRFDEGCDAAPCSAAMDFVPVEAREGRERLVTEEVIHVWYLTLYPYNQLLRFPVYLIWQPSTTVWTGAKCQI